MATTARNSAGKNSSLSIWQCMTWDAVNDPVVKPRATGGAQTERVATSNATGATQPKPEVPVLAVEKAKAAPMNVKTAPTGSTAAPAAAAASKTAPVKLTPKAEVKAAAAPEAVEIPFSSPKNIGESSKKAYRDRDHDDIAEVNKDVNKSYTEEELAQIEMTDPLFAMQIRKRREFKAQSPTSEQIRAVQDVISMKQDARRRKMKAVAKLRALQRKNNAVQLPPKYITPPVIPVKAETVTNRSHSDTSAGFLIGKPPFHSFGKGNLRPVMGGLMYQNYMVSHNASPELPPNVPGRRQVYPNVRRVLRNRVKVDEEDEQYMSSLLHQHEAHAYSQRAHSAKEEKKKKPRKAKAAPTGVDASEAPARAAAAAVAEAVAATNAASSTANSARPSTAGAAFPAKEKDYFVSMGPVTQNPGAAGGAANVAGSFNISWSGFGSGSQSARPLSSQEIGGHSAEDVMEVKSGRAAGLTSHSEAFGRLRKKDSFPLSKPKKTPTTAAPAVAASAKDE